MSNGSSTLLANAYDGAGMRAIKSASDGTTYFLDDAGGQPLVEETYANNAAALSVVDAWAPDGLRERYALPIASETAFFYDPQGTVVSRIVSGDQAVQYDNEVFTDLSVWDGYGQQRSDQWTAGTIDRQYTADDPVGFEGQAGYYQDWELAKPSNPAQYVYLTTTPSLLTHRYYDASTGRFVNRDPIGYQGGTNLYSYCGGNPITNSDPEGTSDDSSHGWLYNAFWRLVGGLSATSTSAGTVGLGRDNQTSGALTSEERREGGLSQYAIHPQAATQSLNNGIKETYTQAGMDVGLPYPDEGYEAVAYGEEELSQVAINFRRGDENPTGGYNVAVFKIRTAAGTEYRAFKSEVGVEHSEQIGWDTLFNEGYKPGDVEAIYSERHPCTNRGNRSCSLYLKDNLPKVPVFYSFLSNRSFWAGLSSVFRR